MIWWISYVLKNDSPMHLRNPLYSPYFCFIFLVIVFVFIDIVFSKFSQKYKKKIYIKKCIQKKIPILLILLYVNNHWIIPELFSQLFSPNYFSFLSSSKSLSVKKLFFQFFVNFQFFNIFLQNSLSQNAKIQFFTNDS